MNYADRTRDFWQHWQEKPDESKELVRFRNRIMELALGIWQDYFQSDRAEDMRNKFRLISGTEYSPYPYFHQSGLHEMLQQAETLYDIADAIRCLLWTMEGSGGLERCCREVKRAIDLSPTIMIRVISDGKSAIVYPTGARLLDEAVVESTLVWLSHYPKVLAPFESALKIYAKKDPTQYRNMLDNLRLGLEEMLRVVLGNNRTLENQKDDFGRWLKDRGVHAQIRNMYQTLIAAFAQYQNDAVKHHEDEYMESEVEFMLYATGTFLRLIQRLLEPGK